VSFVDGNAHQALILETINGVAADPPKVFNGSSRSRIEVERSSSGGRAPKLAVSKSSGRFSKNNGRSLVNCGFLFSFRPSP
jgi:hypothetical protein